MPLAKIQKSVILHQVSFGAVRKHDEFLQVYHSKVNITTEKFILQTKEVVKDNTLKLSTLDYDEQIDSEK